VKEEEDEEDEEVEDEKEICFLKLEETWDDLSSLDSGVKGVGNTSSTLLEVGYTTDTSSHAEGERRWPRTIANTKMACGLPGPEKLQRNMVARGGGDGDDLVCVDG
jgi:hypothetical protein